MNQIILRLPRKSEIQYPIIIDSHLLDRPEQWLPVNWRSQMLVIITDTEVKKHYGEKLLESLKQPNSLLLSFEQGEHAKTNLTKQYLEEQMLQHRCGRNTIILALGGGIVGDVAGFVASTYMRGISFIQIPTTLLAMVDSSIGGKTGINNTHGKNLIGSFWQPTSVIVDINSLITLPQTQLINGLVEIIKMLLTSDECAFNEIHDIIKRALNRDMPTIKNIVQKAIKIKAAIVSQDENENGLRMILNFGHTIGHALEKVTDYTLLHGYAVGLGIIIEAKISQLLGILSNDDYMLILSIFERLDILGSQLMEYNLDDIIQATKSDKKNIHGQVRYVLLEMPGKIYERNHDIVHPVSDETVRNALQIVGEEQYGRK